MVENTVSFRVESVSGGTLTKSGVAVTPGSTLLSNTGAALVWTPGTNDNGTLNAFTVKAWDGALASSSAIQVRIEVEAVADTPTLTTVATLNGGIENKAYRITYTTMAAISDEADGDGDTLSFRIEALSSGTLTKSGAAVSPGSTLLASGESLLWTPASNATGTLDAFTVRAWDGGLASADAIQVRLVVIGAADLASCTQSLASTYPLYYLTQAEAYSMCLGSEDSFAWTNVGLDPPDSQRLVYDETSELVGALVAQMSPLDEIPYKDSGTRNIFDDDEGILLVRLDSPAALVPYDVETGAVQKATSSRHRSPSLTHHIALHFLTLPSPTPPPIPSAASLSTR
jgi:hypothetical protein